MEEKISKLAPSILSADFCKLGSLFLDAFVNKQSEKRIALIQVIEV